MRRNYILIALLSVIIITSIIYGFSVIGLPQDARGMKFDAIRRNDLQAIKTRIDIYATTNKKLPKTINEAIYPDEKTYIKVTDPETAAPYGYQVIDSSNYKLCAKFATKYQSPDGKASADFNKLSRLTNDYVSPSQMYHPKGDHCFTFSVRYYYPTHDYPSPTPSITFNISDKNIRSVTTSSSYDQSSKFPEGFFSTNANEYGLVNYKNQNVYVTVSFQEPMKLTQITNTFAMCDSASCDSISTTNLINIEGETEDYQRISLANNLKISEKDTVLTIPVTTDKEFSKVTFRVFGPIIWKKMQFSYK